MLGVLRKAPLPCLIALLAVACDHGSSEQSSQQAPGTISGRERIGWDQQAPDAAALSRYTWVLYVDDRPVDLTGATCGALSGEGPTASCSSPLPALQNGQHKLELATRVNRDGEVVESARSAPLVVTVAGSVASGSAASAAQAGVLRFAAATPYVVETVVSGLDRPSGLARLPDGRLLVAERGGRIRIVEAGVLLEAPAAGLADADAGEDERVSLAVAPDFASTRHVYVSYVERDAGGDRIGRVVRFREVAGSLGEAAVLVDGLPVQLGAPRVRIGPDGALYIGTDALDLEDGDDLGSQGGKILRLTERGGVPPDNPSGSSPVFSAGHRGRVDFDWDPVTKAMWHVEAYPEGVSLGRQDGAPRSERVAYFEGVQTTGAAFSVSGAPMDWRGSLFLASPDQECLYRVTGLSSSPVQPSIERLFANSYGRIVAVVSGDDGLYFAASNGATNDRGEPAGAVYRIPYSRVPNDSR
jgi:glucose/arabinose dehydrogenase